MHKNMREIAQNCTYNAPKSSAAGVPPKNLAGGAYDAPPDSLIGWGGGHPSSFHSSSLNAFDHCRWMKERWTPSIFETWLRHWCPV